MADLLPATDARRQFRLIFVAVVLSLLLSGIDTTLITAALPAIVADIGGLPYLSWTVSIYLLFATLTMPMYGRAADTFGRQRMFKVALIVFVAGSATAALTQSMPQLIAARALQGAGAGGLVSLPRALIASMVEPRDRARYQAWASAFASLGAAAGPILGGVVVDNFHWRWAFVASLPIAGACIAITSVTQVDEQLKDWVGLDAFGAAMTVVAVTPVLLVTLWGGRQFAWDSPQILGLILLSLIATRFLVVRERAHPSPFLPLNLLPNPILARALVLSLLIGPTMYGTLAYAPTFMQISLSISPTHAGALIAPFMVGTLTGTVWVGRSANRNRHLGFFTAAGCGLVALAIFLLATMDEQSAPGIAAVYLGAMGTGIGMLVPTIIVGTQNAVRDEELGTATAALYFVRSLSAAVGLAALGALFNARLASRIASSAIAGLEGANLQDILESPGQLSGISSAAQAAVRSGVAAGSRAVFVANGLIGIVMFLVGLQLWRHQRRTGPS